ncbi:6203_t:CDS:2, partial [Dentiscutata heterogama]
MDSLDFDLHELILDQLASILSIDVDTTNEDALRLANRCPELPTDKDPGIGKPQQSIGFITKSYRQNISALASFAHQSQALVHNDCLQEIGKIIDMIIHSSDPAHVYIKKFLARYQSQGYPLSTNGIILGLTI